jgi:NAD(P)-dependent dehydrogenase (short-subunit alcohol dehydrogenase family)
MHKVILITGTSSGLGEVITKILSSQNIVYAGARSPDEVPVGTNIKPIKLDITSEADCKEGVEKIIREEGRIDVVINNAGYGLVGPTTDFSSEDFLKILDTNTVGAFRLIKYVVPHMKKRKEGRIINITSLNGLISLPNFGLYSASKHGLEALGIALRYELIKYGIWVTNLAPGAIYSKEEYTKALPHKPAREKFRILYFLMPMVTREQIARKIEELIETPRPPVEVLMGADAKITTFLKRFLPSFAWEYLMNFVWSKK